MQLCLQVLLHQCLVCLHTPPEPPPHHLLIVAATQTLGLRHLHRHMARVQHRAACDGAPRHQALPQLGVARRLGGLTPLGGRAEAQLYVADGRDQRGELSRVQGGGMVAALQTFVQGEVPLDDL